MPRKRVTTDNPDNANTGNIIQLPMPGTEVEIDYLIQQACSKAGRLIRGAIAVWENPYQVREKIEEALKECSRAILHLSESQEYKNFVAIGRIAKVATLLITALDNFDSDKKTIEDSLVELAKSNQLLAKVEYTFK